MKKQIKDLTRYEILLHFCYHNDYDCSRCILNSYNKENAHCCICNTLLELKYQEEEFERHIKKEYNEQKAKLKSLKNKCKEVLTLEVEVNEDD